jgi:hypothetical protein
MREKSQSAFCLKAADSFHALFFYVLLFTSYFLLSSSVFAQNYQYDVEPPPLKIISKTEKVQLEATNDIKQRTKLALELMEARLISAEGLSAKEEYSEMFTELGSFHALVDNTLNFLDNNNNDSGKVLNNYKRIELSLRKYITRLELIRRNLPLRYEFYVRRLVKYIREARTKAVEPMFADTGGLEREPR